MQLNKTLNEYACPCVWVCVCGCVCVLVYYFVFGVFHLLLIVLKKAGET